MNEVIMKNDYWDELIELCKEENRLVKREVLIDSLVNWGLVLSVVALLVLIFLQ
jgi:hypothetical protein